MKVLFFRTRTLLLLIRAYNERRTQTGLVGCASIDDYCNNVILKHENTLEAKEQDRIRHIDACSAQTGPIFLAYRADKKLGEIIKNVRLTPEVYDFTSDDG